MWKALDYCIKKIKFQPAYYSLALKVFLFQSSSRRSKSHISPGSVFSGVTCKEDLQHIREIVNTNLMEKNESQLTEILYKSVTKPVQGKNHYGKKGHNMIIRAFNYACEWRTGRQVDLG